MLYQFRFIFVIACLGLAAALLTDKHKLPLALRGLRRVLRKDAGEVQNPDKDSTITPIRRLLAFVLILIAFAIAVV